MPDPISNNNTSPMPSAPSVITPEQEIANPDAADIAASILPSVTSVLTSAAGMQGGGSGVVLSGDGLILTNNHVIAGAETIQVRFDDGTTTGASTVGVDNADDLAVIRAAGVTGLSPAHLTSPVRVGEPVLAFGSPFGLAGTVTEGIVSAVNRPVWTAAPKGPGQGEDAIVDTIQTDAAVNPGNSGGPLVDMSGNVVGINSAFATLPSTASAGVMPLGIGFAIPAEQADRIARQLIATGHATRADLGATVDENTNPLTAPATIAAVQAGGSAEKAGLEVGDTITAFGGRPLDSAAALLAALHSAPPDSIIQITYRRGPASNTISVTLGSIPAE
jgi:putative serine protease PepD